jgi:hypothetical protein
MPSHPPCHHPIALSSIVHVYPIDGFEYPEMGKVEELSNALSRSLSIRPTSLFQTLSESSSLFGNLKSSKDPNLHRFFPIFNMRKDIGGGDGDPSHGIYW